MVMPVLADGVQPMSLIVRAWRRLWMLPGLPEAYIRCWLCMSLAMALSPLLLAADDGVFVATANVLDSLRPLAGTNLAEPAEPACPTERADSDGPRASG
ncbi:MAG TPA: hypothetical protein DIW77_18540 [Chromatiaceae bacterium]|jgi:hypothetical protein|nr:hypothetical protein [Chromatiaceae bacterium]